MTRRALQRLRRLGAAWTAWAGGSCPLAAGTRVVALLRDGSLRRGRAGEWSWSHDHEPDGFQEPDEIVAFRVRAPALSGVGA